MAGFIITPKMTPVEALNNLHGIEKWFREHPTRRVCRTNYGWSVRRGYIVQDVMLHTRMPVNPDDVS